MLFFLFFFEIRQSFRCFFLIFVFTSTKSFSRIFPRNRSTPKSFSRSVVQSQNRSVVQSFNHIYIYCRNGLFCGTWYYAVQCTILHKVLWNLPGSSSDLPRIFRDLPDLSGSSGIFRDLSSAWLK